MREGGVFGTVKLLLSFYEGLVFPCNYLLFGV